MPPFSLLADGLGGLLIATWVAVGLACTAIAILVEIPIMTLIWRRLSWLVVGLVVVANLVSACAGGIPARSRYDFTMPDVTSDPWVAHTHYWQDFLPWVAILFVATCVIECLCFLPLRIRKKKRLSLRALIAGTVVGNAASYFIITGVIWYMPPKGTGDFEFLPDTSWVQPGDQRVWFCDPKSNYLCSVRLDGSDWRTETDQKLKRFDWYFEEISVYVLVPERNLVLYVDADGNWRVREGSRERVLCKMPLDAHYMRRDIFERLPGLLPEMSASVIDEHEVIEGVYFSAGVHYWRSQAVGDKYKVNTHLAWGIGPDSWGVTVTTKEGGSKLRFGIKRGVTQMFCRDPEILEKEKLILFRCGGWIMVMDPVQHKVGRLVRGDSMVVHTPYFTSDSYR